MDKSPKRAAKSLFNDLEDVKEFLSWAKSEGIQSVKVADVEVTFNALAFLPTEDLKEITNGGASTLAETEPTKDEDEELLFLSSN